MKLIDTHAHIYLPEFDEDRQNIIETAALAGVEHIIMPAIDSETHKQMLEAEDTYNGCLSMIGLHPCSVKDNYVDELKIVENNLLQRSFVAIGEIGLDFYWDKIHIPQQIDAFTKQIELALKFNLPIVFLSRYALIECIDIVKL